MVATSAVSLAFASYLQVHCCICVRLFKKKAVTESVLHSLSGNIPERSRNDPWEAADSLYDHYWLKGNGFHSTNIPVLFEYIFSGGPTLVRHLLEEGSYEFAVKTANENTLKMKDSAPIKGRTSTPLSKFGTSFLRRGSSQPINANRFPFKRVAGSRIPTWPSC